MFKKLLVAMRNAATTSIPWATLMLTVAAGTISAQAAPGGRSWTLVNGVVSGMNGVETLGRIPGDIRNVDITPVWPDANTVETPGTFVRKGVMFGNEFFASSQYGTNCDNSLVLTPAHTEWQGMGAGFVNVPATYACKLTAAPIVDMNWVHANLDTKGYTYEISYPLENHGNSRALISWVKACWVTISGQSTPAYCWHGYARLDGAPEGWLNQYTAATKCMTMFELQCTSYKTFQHGSDVQDAQANWPEPYRSTAVAIYSWSDGLVIGTASMWSRLDPTLWPLSDDWLAGTGPSAVSASLPSIPPYVPAGEPSAINVGGASSGGGAGAAGETNIDGRNTLKFDFAAYCNAPGKDGQPRSPAWIQSCMTGH